MADKFREGGRMTATELNHRYNCVENEVARVFQEKLAAHYKQIADTWAKKLDELFND